MPTTEALAPHFPELEIGELQGRGGMGVVYRAKQRALGRDVALKILAVPERAPASFAERFSVEARALASLDHPSIVTVHDFGERGGYFFLTMELVEGENLRQAMRSGAITAGWALSRRSARRCSSRLDAMGAFQGELGVALQSWPVVLTITAAIVVATGLSACFAPILRGLRIRPVEALRVDA